MSDTIADLIRAERLPANYREVVKQYWQPLANRIARLHVAGSPLVIGINGAQGSGKSTMCRFLEMLLAREHIRAVTLSLDDLYLTRSERRKLAEDVHPLFVTRGVPGTHDAGLGLGIIEHLRAGRPLDLPRFDKRNDDRAPTVDHVTFPVDVLLLEGWCVGAKPQDDAALAQPINDLERQEDPQATWRKLVNRRLGEDYARLFDKIDLLVMLKVAGFDAVRRNRAVQEEKLRLSSPGSAAVMDDTALARFCAHYERLTRHMLAEMPSRADVLIEIGPDQNPIGTSDTD